MNSVRHERNSLSGSSAEAIESDTNSTSTHCPWELCITPLFGSVRFLPSSDMGEAEFRFTHVRRWQEPDRAKQRRDAELPGTMGAGRIRVRFDRLGGRSRQGISLVAHGIHQETSAMSGGDFPTEVLRQ